MLNRKSNKLNSKTKLEIRNTVPSVINSMHIYVQVLCFYTYAVLLGLGDEEL